MLPYYTPEEKDWYRFPEKNSNQIHTASNEHLYIVSM
jgi:hypothetical protein